MNSNETTEIRRYLRALTQEHHDDPDFKVEFACWFNGNDSGLVHLLEVSPTVLDPGDASFDTVLLGLPREVKGAQQVGVILVSPQEFLRAAKDPTTPGGDLLEHLREQRDFDVLLGEQTPYAEALSAPTPG